MRDAGRAGCDPRRVPGSGRVIPHDARSGAGMSEAQVKSPGPTKIHCRMMPIALLANQYRPTPAGLAKTIQPNIAGMMYSIIWFIWAC